MPFAHGDVRDHIVTFRIDHGPPKWRCRATQQQRSPKIDFREILGLFDFRLLQHELIGFADFFQICLSNERFRPIFGMIGERGDLGYDLGYLRHGSFGRDGPDIADLFRRAGGYVDKIQFGHHVHPPSPSSRADHASIARLEFERADILKDFATSK
jgi:hypothetical protein